MDELDHDFQVEVGEDLGAHPIHSEALAVMTLSEDNESERTESCSRGIIAKESNGVCSMSTLLRPTKEYFATRIQPCLADRPGCATVCTLHGECSRARHILINLISSHHSIS